MSVAKGFKEISVFSNHVEKIEMEYDFAKDGGLVSVIDLGKFPEAMVIMDAVVKVKTAVVSGGSATVEIGVKGGDTDAIMAATLQAALLVDTTVPGASACKGLYLAAGAQLSAEIKVAALTAGKLVVSLMVQKF